MLVLSEPQMAMQMCAAGVSMTHVNKGIKMNAAHGWSMPRA
jgi:hypothetical protein